MSDKNFKTIRKQLRNVVQEILPATLNAELTEALYTRLSTEINARLDRLQANTEQTLKDIDQRSKDVQAYIIRNTTAAIPVADLPPPADVGAIEVGS